MALDKGILGANGIVGGEIPIATGATYTAKVKEQGKSLYRLGIQQTSRDFP